MNKTYIVDKEVLEVLIEKTLKYEAFMAAGIKNEWPRYYDALADGLAEMGIHVTVKDDEEIDWEDYSEAVEKEIKRWQ